MAAAASNVQYSDQSGEEEESDEDSDSDNDCSLFKRTKVKKAKLKCDNFDRNSQKSSRDKFKIWSTELQDAALTEELTTNCELESETFERTRDVESYNYNLPYLLGERPYPPKQSRDKKERRNSMFSEKDEDDPSTNKRKFHERKWKNHRQRRRWPSNEGRNNEAKPELVPRDLLDLTVTVENTDDEVSCDIANKLCEPKQDLIGKHSLFLFLVRSMWKSAFCSSSIDIIQHTL